MPTVVFQTNFKKNKSYVCDEFAEKLSDAEP